MAVNDHSYVVVAVPSRKEPVWEISSEKVPHMTLLFLGKTLDNLPGVKNFIKHTVDTTMSRFTLGVERRGVLGSDKADVLFFPKTAVEQLADFRAHLLSNLNIFTAYSSIEQFPDWTPHLTLGYPENPAKPPVDPEFPDIHTVSFDRIELWTGDYEGVTIPLKIDDKELSMTERGAAYLEHFGVKGMKWGVSRGQARAAGGAVKAQAKAHYLPSQDAKDAQRAQFKAKLGGTRAMSNAEMRKVINRMALEKQYRDLYGEHQLHDEAVSRAKRWTKRGGKYIGNLLTDILRDGGSSWLKRPGSNTSGRTTSRAGTQFGKVIDGSIVERRAIGA